MSDKEERKAELVAQLAQAEAQLAEQKERLARRDALVIGHWQKRVDKIKASLEALDA